MIFLPLTVAEDDWAGWKILHGALGEQIELVGDDLFVTNVKYIQRGIDENLANSALIKLNQIGSLVKPLMRYNFAMTTTGAPLSHTAVVRQWTALSPI